MAIDIAHLDEQIGHLEAEKKQTVARLHNIDGALALARNLKGRCERQEDEAAQAENDSDTQANHTA